MTLGLRRLEASDDVVIRRLFRETMCLGRPLDLSGRLLDRYENLCLDWYLGPERELARVLDDGGVVRGYVLVSARSDDHSRWSRRAAVRFGAGALISLVAGRQPPEVRQFLRLRLRDGWVLRNSPSPAPVHAHMNVDPGLRDGRGALLFLAYVAEICAEVGAPAWYGEINAAHGRRAAALERRGGRVVHRAPNHTLSWLTGGPVERLTVVFS